MPAMMPLAASRTTRPAHAENRTRRRLKSLRGSPDAAALAPRPGNPGHLSRIGAGTGTDTDAGTHTAATRNAANGDAARAAGVARTIRTARRLEPPRPPLALTPLLACETADEDILWHIAHEAPELRRWLVANPHADALLLEYVAQASGPGVNEAFHVFFASMDESVDGPADRPTDGPTESA